jgi:hypothetical protein
MEQLGADESQSVMTSLGRGGRKLRPHQERPVGAKRKWNERVRIGFRLNLKSQFVMSIYMAKNKIQSTLPDQVVMNKIYVIRGQNVMLDFDLAELYHVETSQLKRQVRRNIDRFPPDFMFELTQEEFKNLKSQFGTSSWGGIRYMPMAFTEQGVSMLSGVLNSQVAIQVHIQIIRIFTKMKEMLMTNKEILLKVEKMELEVTNNKKDIATIFKALRQLLNQPQEPRKRFGFKPDK